MYDTKKLLGKILGEIYRIQKHTDGIACAASGQQIYGLLKGIEEAIYGVVLYLGLVIPQVNLINQVLNLRLP